MNSEFSSKAVEDLLYWASTGARKSLKIIKLVQEISRNPYEGTGMPEPLKHNLSGCWSRRIDKEHRIVYKIEKEKLIILSCRHHY